MNPEVLRAAFRALDEQCQQARAEGRAKGSRHDIDPNALKPAKRWVGRLDGYGIALIRGEFYEVPATPPLFPDIRDVDVFRLRFSELAGRRGLVVGKHLLAHLRPARWRSTARSRMDFPN